MMKIFKKIVLLLCIILVTLVIGLIAFGFYMKPKYEGQLQLKNIDKETTVYFDEFGIPHIYAANSKDAMTALGYVHAQDRLWQMELLRRIAPARLSEIFGTVALKNDQLFCGLGIEEASERAISTLDKNSECCQLAMAYLDGINQFIEEGTTPIEFQLVGVKKEKFTIKDIYNIFGYMSFSFAMAQKTDPLVTDIRNKYGMSYLRDLGLDVGFDTIKDKSKDEKSKEFLAVSRSVTNLLEKAPFSPFVGSNSWVIGPQKTKNGKVIFANDPHIGFSQPGTWYEAHIVTPEFESYGCYLSGTPFPLLGHNRKYAFGLTMFENDDADFYQEENNADNETQYKTPLGYANYIYQKKIIKVKDSSDVVMNIKISLHGPVMNNLFEGLDNSKPIAFSWIYTQQPIKILEASYLLSHADNMAEFQNGIKLIAAPGLNVMYGDNQGNIARWTTGKLYKHSNGVNTNFILNGVSGKEEIVEYLDFSKNPSKLNPNTNYVSSANSQLEAIDGYLYPGYYLPTDRAERINHLLDSKSNWDKESAGEMILDNTSTVALEVVKNLIAYLDTNSLSGTEKEAVKILKSWKGTNDLDDIAPTIFNKWVYFYLKYTFEDEMGEKGFEQFLKTYFMKQVIEKQIANEQSLWWDNVNTKNIKETRKDILNKSFKEAVLNLESQLGESVSSWTWNKVHVVEYKHPLGEVAVLRRFFNVGPFQVSGSNEVINNQFFDYTNDSKYTVNGGPSSRRVIDFSDIENCFGILPTGQSGNPFSSHYDDQAKLYNEGKFRKMKLNEAEIIKSSTKLVFIPNKK